MDNNTEEPKNQRNINQIDRSNNYASLAKSLFNAGYEPIPCSPGFKYWKHPGWESIKLPVSPWPAGHGISIRCGDVVGLDIDVADNRIINFLLDRLDFEYITRTGQAPKVLIPIRCPELKEKLVSDRYVSQNGTVHQIELLSFGQQFVCYHIHPDTKKPYEWSGDLLSHVLPTVPLSFLEYIFSLFYDEACRNGWKNLSRKKFVAVSGKKTEPKGERIGDLYNHAFSVEELLPIYGWKHYRGKHWTRPGKETGNSGTVLDRNAFYVFTSSTCLESERVYDPFGLMTTYEFSGDFSRSAKAVSSMLRGAA